MKRRQYTAEYKVRIVLEILREENTVSEIGSRESINPQQLHNWKKEFLENAGRVFSTNKEEKEARHRVMEQLEEKEMLEKKSVTSPSRMTGSKKSGQLLGEGWEQKNRFRETGFKK